MNAFTGFHFGLGSLPLMSNAVTRSISSEPASFSDHVVCFREDLRVTIQALGWWPNG